MLPWQTNLVHQLEELHLIQCSLLPGECFAFVLPPEDLSIWTSLVDAFTDAGGLDDADEEGGVIASLTRPPCQACFEVRVVGAQVWFEVTLPRCTDLALAPNPTTPINVRISVKGEHVSRDVQEHWYAEIRDWTADMDDPGAFPVYGLLTFLTTTLHQSQAVNPDPAPTPASSVPTPTPFTPPPSEEKHYHALLTSHHLVSSTKRRSMHQWSLQLGIAGFAKVGYPGIVYAEGPRDAVETFVRNVKGMQWLALRVRFVEPVPVSSSGSDCLGTSRDQSVREERWVEVSKIGEVLQQMRTRGREDFVTNLGIGAPSKEPKH